MIAKKKAPSRYHFREHATNLAFLLPATALFAFVVLIPFFQSIPYSFTDWKSIMSDSWNWVGFRNYELMLSNQYFRNAFIHTLHFTVLYVIGANLLGLLLALLLQRSSKFNNFARTFIFLPFTVALTSGAIVWSYVFTDVYCNIFGTISPLGDSSQVINGMAIIAIWRDLGYCMLIYIAALQSIPRDYYEAATVEGAGKLQQTFRITLPLIVPAFTSNITLLLAWGLRCFDYPMAVARNMEAAQTTAMFIYDYIFGYSKAGLGQAAAIMLTLVLIIITQFVTRALRRMEVEA